MNHKHILEMENVNKAFGPVEVLRGFNLRLHYGEKVVIIGPSGSGKSTVLRCINRLEPVQGGTIRFEGETLTDKTNLCKLRAKIGMVFQRFNLFPHKTALENIIEAPLIVKKMARDEAEAIADRLLEQVGLADRRDSYPRELSGGQQQRVAIARALVNNPRLIVCDEPTSALDADTGRLVMDVLRKNALSEDRALIIVTHDNRIFSFADRIARMDDGRIILVEPQVATS